MHKNMGETPMPHSGGFAGKIDLADPCKYIATSKGHGRLIRKTSAMRIPLTSYGRREILIATCVCGALIACVALIVPAALFWPMALIPAAAWICVLAFFRDPGRRFDEQDAFIAPADGRIADITPVHAQGPLGSAGVRIGIFMSVLNVHVNRSPCSGVVTRIEHHDGGYLDARSPQASERNESTTTWLTVNESGRSFTVVVRQIAGLVARRIVTDLRNGQVLAAGERIGMIKFGSRVEVMIPDELTGRILVHPGQAVRGGKTALVRLPRTPAPREQP